MGLLSSLGRALARADERIDGAEALVRGAVASLGELAQQTTRRADLEAINVAAMALANLTYEPYRQDKSAPLSPQEVATMRLRRALAVRRFAVAGIELPPELRPS